MLIPDKYTEILQTLGRPLNDIGVNEVALSRPAALEAIDALGAAPIAILGGDVLGLSGDHPAYSGDNWYYKRRDNEALPEFIANSRDFARKYIQSYNEPANQRILYTLVVSELGV